MLSNDERQKIIDLFDIYDLIEALNLGAAEFVDAFDFLIIDNEEIMDKVNGNS